MNTPSLLYWRKAAALLIASMAILAALLIWSAPAHASPSSQASLPVVLISTNITSNSTWSPTNIYVVAGDLSVTNGATLTIEAGTIVKFIDDSSLVILNGDLLLGGISANPVIFTSIHDDANGGDTNADGTNTTPAPGDWDAIELNTNLPAGFHHALVMYSSWGLMVENNGVTALNPTITQNTFTNNLFGIYLKIGSSANITSLISDNVFYNNRYGLGTALLNTTVQGTALPVLQSNTFESNTGLPISLGGTAFPVVDGTNQFIGSPTPEKKLGIGISGNFNTSGTWTIVNGMPYVVLANTVIESGESITIPQDSVIKFDRYLDNNNVLQNSRLEVRGTLNIQGNDGHLVTLTSVRDDSIGGDTNGDSGDLEPFPGDWDSLYFYNTAQEVHHLRVKFSSRGVLVYNTAGTLTPAIQNNEFINNIHSVYYLTANNTSQTLGTLANNSFVVYDDSADLRVRKLTSFPVVLNGTAFPAYSGNSFVNHARPAIGLLGNWNFSGTWAALLGDNDQVFPYVVMNNTIINNPAPGVTIQVPAGIVFKFDKWLDNNVLQRSKIDVFGVLDLQSTAENKIVFTSYKDDSVKGDTNFDGVASAGVAGDWDGVILRNTNNSFHDSLVKYAQRGCVVYNTSSGELNIPIANSLFINNVAGVSLTISKVNDTTPTVTGDITSLISGNTFLQNTYGLETGVYYNTSSQVFAVGASRPTLNNNRFEGNTGFPIFLGGTAFPEYGITNIFIGNIHPAIGIGGNFAATGILNQVIGEEGLVYPYVVVNHLLIRTGEVTLLPGTIFKFETTKYMDVSGSLRMESSAGYPVTFTSYKDDSYDDTNADGSATSPARENWEAVYLRNSGTDFHDAVVKYSKYGVSPYASTAANIAPPVRNSVFSENTYGVYFRITSSGNITSHLTANQFLTNTYCVGSFSNTNPYARGGAFPLIINNTFSGCGFPFYFNGTADPTYTGNSFLNSTHPAIAVGGFWAQNATWTHVSGDGGAIFPYVVLNTITQDAVNEPILVVPPGTIVKFDLGKYFYADGILDAKGTADQPIVFTSYRDDTFAGDTNADAAATTPTYNDWKTIWLGDTPTKVNHLEHILARYATAAVGVYYDGPAYTAVDTSITNSLFENNGSGVALAIGWGNTSGCTLPGKGDINASLTNLQFLNNQNGIITFTHQNATGTIAPQLTNIQFVNTAKYPLFFGGTTSPIIGSGVTISAPYVQIVQSDLQPSQEFSVSELELAVSDIHTARTQTIPAGEPRAYETAPSTAEAGFVTTTGGPQAIGLGGYFNNAAVLPIFAGVPYAINGDYPMAYILCGSTINVSQNLTVGKTNPSGSVVTLPEGAVVKLGLARKIDVFGDLNLMGTLNKPVTFTSMKDDSVGGDTNRDFGSTFPARGDWDAVALQSSATRFEYALVKYANRGLAIEFTGAANTNIEPEVLYSLFTENKAGITLTAVSQGDIWSDIHHNLFTSNTTHIVGTQNASTGRLQVTIYSNDLVAPAGKGIDNLSTNWTIDARGNYWGNETGPFHPTTNPDGKGVTVSDRVDYGSYLNSPTWSGATYSISGRVVRKDQQPLTGVTVQLSTGVTVQTDATGFFKFDNLQYGSYTVTPTLSGHFFTPGSAVVLTPPDAVSPTFVGEPTTVTLYTIGGRVSTTGGVSIQNVVVHLNNGASTLTGSDGRYSFSGLAVGTYTVTPTFGGYVFVPAFRTVTVSPNNLMVNFTVNTTLPGFHYIYIPFTKR